MVKHPVVAAVTYVVWNFSMRPQVRSLTPTRFAASLHRCIAPAYAVMPVATLHYTCHHQDARARFDWHVHLAVVVIRFKCSDSGSACFKVDLM